MEDWEQDRYIRIWIHEFHEMKHDPTLFFVWGDSLHRAAWKKQSRHIGRKEIILKPGQFIFTYAGFARELGISRNQLKSRIDYLKRDEKVTIETYRSPHNHSIMTIHNWEKYNGGH